MTPNDFAGGVMNSVEAEKGKFHILSLFVFAYFILFT